MRFFALPLAVLLAASGAAGCAGEHDVADKQLADLRAEMAKLRADHARLTERLDNLELARGSFHGANAGATADPAVPAAAPRPLEDRPDLAVVHLGPDASADTDDPDDNSPRPVVRASGSGGVVQDRLGKGKAVGGAQDELDKALELYKTRAYDKALEALAGFAVKYPDHPGVETATFYRAECYLAKGDAKRAVEQYEAVVTGFPQGAKAPDALLRESTAYGKLGDKASSDQTKKRLLSTYPGSDAAKKLAKPGSEKKKP
jgi:tol-pal system protein YbgF